MFYEVWLQAVVTYHRTVKMEHMTKKRVVAEQIHLQKEEYMEVCPYWCDGKLDAWEVIVDRWMDEARRSYSGECRDWRGKEGTHCQGSLSFARYKEKKVYICNILGFSP